MTVFCDRHEANVGDPFPPKCLVCEALTVEYEIYGIDPARAQEQLDYPIYKKREI